MLTAQMLACSSDATVIRRVGIVGVGMMGAAIAAANVRRGMAVTLADADDRALATVFDRISRELSDLAHGGAEIDQWLGQRASLASDYDRLEPCDLVLESIVESAAAKEELLARLETCIKPGALLASNTSTIPIARLSRTLRQPGRFLGLHFFHPVARRPLIEIVRGPDTEASAVAAAADYAQAIEKTPIVVADGPGFLVNRLLGPYLAEAMELLLEGVSVEEIERAAREFGMAMGPIRLVDEIGIDTALLGGRVLWEAFPDRITPSPLLLAMFKAKRLGRKTLSGFFGYRSRQGPETDLAVPQDVLDLIAAWARRPASSAKVDLMVRLLLPMALEAARMIEEHRVEGPESIDLAVCLGLGFPAARGGLLRWADTLGPRRILALSASLADHGARFQPPRLLETMARANRGFYAVTS